MKTFIYTLIMILSSLLLKAQNTYETKMQTALDALENAQSEEDLTKVTQKFDSIASEEKNHWQPQYYAIYTEIINAFGMPPKDAEQTIEKIKLKYNNLDSIQKNNTEIMVLKPLYQTVLVSKNPMKYGRELSQTIKSNYKNILSLDANNPRAKYLLAQYEIMESKYIGGNIEGSCAELSKAISIFEKQKTENFNPAWGKNEAVEVKNTYCTK